MAWISDYQRWLSESESLQNAQLVVNHFKGTEWTKESLSAMCGNMRHESSINPNMYEYGYQWSADRGFGLVQWTPRSKYWNWATSRGLDQRSGSSQLKRIDYEVENNIQWIPRSSYGNMTFKQFRTNSGNWSVNYLTEAFTWGYERPNETAGWNSMPARKAFANRCFNELDFTGSGSGGNPIPPAPETKPVFPTTPGLSITSPYGWRTHPITGEYKFHAGIDIGGGGVNHPIYATQTGVVSQSYWSDSSGWTLRIRHTRDGYHSQYIHLASKASVAVGQSVTKGQRVATMGTTGNSTGIHLDFAISPTGSGWFTETGTIDPADYLNMSFGGGDDGAGGGTAITKEKEVAALLLVDALNGWKL